MMIKVDGSHETTLTIEYTPQAAKRYFVVMKAGAVTVMAQATDLLILNWGNLSADGFVNYRLNDATDAEVVKQFIKDTENEH